MTERQPLVQQKSTVSRPWGRILGVAAALAVSVVAVQTLGPVKLGAVRGAPSSALLAAASGDSSDVFGCGCTIQWCCDNKDLFDDDFVTTKEGAAGDSPCSLLRDPILGNREAGNPPFDANTICAEVESGKRNGSTSVCDQPEMSLVTAVYSQGSQDMIIVTFGKSCSEGPSCELPGTYVGDTLYTELPDQVIGTWCGVGSGYTLEKTGIKGFDARTNKHGTVTLGTCDVDECVLGKGIPVYVTPHEVDYDDKPDPCSWGGDKPDASAYVGPFDNKTAYAACVDFQTVSGAGGRVVFTSVSGSDDVGLNSELFAKANPKCVKATPPESPV
mmetsp:Transcript_21865/g.67327  ORF Transcript_21865/g.67327 Transcript_21865/m.67327 type:complete len:330 (-) Transcript_21865:91-1080(-)